MHDNDINDFNSYFKHARWKEKNLQLNLDGKVKVPDAIQMKLHAGRLYAAVIGQLLSVFLSSSKSQ